MLELGRTGHSEALEKLAADERRGPRPVAGGGKGVEVVGIELDCVGGDADAIGVRLQAGIAGAAPQDAQGLVQGVPRSPVRLVGPQQADQVVAGAGALRGPCQVDEQRQVLAPQQLRRRRTAVESHVHGAECAAADHRPQVPSTLRRASPTRGS